MATQKLYPPILAGTTPPFYMSDAGTYLLTVPFTLNKLNAISELGGVKLKIRDADTDIELGKVDAINGTISLSFENSQATFDISSISGITVGKYYKIQLAHVDINDSTNIGYYSSISIVKCTAYPTVAILGLSSYSNNIDTTYYTGRYTNINDASEKCYSYKFTLFNSNNEILTTTGWKIHNANTNDSKWESTDQYTLEYICSSEERYRIQYSVTTTNGLVVSSPAYLLSGSSSVAPLLDAYVDASLNYDNGCVDIVLLPNMETVTATTQYVGTFMLSRLCSKDNYQTQIQIASFALTGTLPITAIFHDFTVEHGYSYKYALQQYNTHGIYSSRLYSKEVEVYFEDAFLFDGIKQLRIRFNPKISTFKTVLQDSKKNTLGSKYPFFFRNGTVEYKEFPISGLISYRMDENEFFLSRQEDLQMTSDFDWTLNIVDDNIAYERKFKLEVLNWLNDGNLKLFRSPTEGNYLVRLSDISLTPNETVSRMIHTFQCTADEIADFTPANLLHYGFLHVDDNVTLDLRFGTINFDKQIETLISILQRNSNTLNASEEVVNQALQQFAEMDLLDGRQCQYLKFDECTPGETWFMLNGKQYVIGATGSYEVSMPKDAMLNSLHIINPTRHMPGSLTYGIWTTKSSIFDMVTQITQRDVFDCPTASKYNYMDSIETIKDSVKNMLFMQFTLKDTIYEIESVEAWQKAYNFYLYQTNRLASEVEPIVINNQTFNIIPISDYTLCEQYILELNKVIAAMPSLTNGAVNTLYNHDPALYPTNNNEDWKTGDSQLRLIGKQINHLKNCNALWELINHYSLNSLPGINFNHVNSDNSTSIEVEWTNGSGKTILESGTMMLRALLAIYKQISSCQYYRDVPMNVKVYHVAMDISDTDLINAINRSEQLPGFKSYTDLFIDDTYFYCPSTGIYYKYSAENDTIYEYSNMNPWVTINKDNQQMRVQLTNSQICIDDEIIDIAERGILRVPFTSKIPKQLYWGIGVNTIIAYQLLTVKYGVESAVEAALGQVESLHNLWNTYSAIAQKYYAGSLKLLRLTASKASDLRKLVQSVPDGEYEENSYYVWNNDTLHFDRLTKAERSTFTGSEVWVPWAYTDYKESPIWTAGSIRKDGFLWQRFTATLVAYESAKRTYFDTLEAVLALDNLEVVIN